MRQLLYIYILRLVFIPYFKIVANRNKDLINNRNQVDILKTFFRTKKTILPELFYSNFQ